MQDRVQEYVQEQWLRPASRTLAACTYRWSSGSGVSGCMRASRPVRRMRSRRSLRRVGFRWRGRSIMPWSACWMSPNAKARLLLRAPWRRRGRGIPARTRSPRSPRRLTFERRMPSRNLWRRSGTTVSRCSIVLQRRAPSLTRSSPMIVAVIRVVIRKVIRERTCRPHPPRPRLVMQLLHQSGDPRKRCGVVVGRLRLRSDQVLHAVVPQIADHFAGTHIPASNARAAAGRAAGSDAGMRAAGRVRGRRRSCCYVCPWCW